MVEMPSGYYYFGGYDMNTKEITALMVEPGRNPKATTIKDDLDSLQKAVSIGADYQGLIEIVGLENGVSYCNEERFKAYYKDLIKAIQEASPSTNIILQSVFPVSRSAEKSSPNISNDRIDEANRWIAEICEECSVKYLNTASALKDKNGYLAAEYDSGNGIILNAAGYKTVIQYIKTHGYK